MCAALTTQEQDMMTSSVSFVKAMARKDLGENTRFHSGTVLTDGRLIMSDDQNKRLVQLDDNYEIVKEYKVHGDTVHAVSAGYVDNEVYLAYNKRYVDRCNLDPELTVVKRIETQAGTDGVAACGDKVAVANGLEFQILTQDGKVLQTHPQKGYFCFIASDESKKTCYYKNNYDIVCRTWGGEILFNYKSGQIKEPRGICLDTYGNVYVTNGDDINGKVHQISSDGQSSRVLLKEPRHFKHVYGLVFRPQRNELIVTSYNENTVFEVYKLG